jgi:predicted DCC family thiol-disulfide oxidoreductase YuxK
VGQRARDTVIYDEGCPVCRRTVRWIRERDVGGSLRLVPADSAQARVMLDRPALSGGDLDGVVFIENARAGTGASPDQVSAGSQAMRRIALRLEDRSRLARLVNRLPGFLQDLGYRFVARVRPRDARRGT